MQSPRFGWKNLPFAEMLAERVHFPVWIDDDVNAFAVAQKLSGVGRDHPNFAALAIAAGIGCSLVIKGEIHHEAIAPLARQDIKFQMGWRTQPNPRQAPRQAALRFPPLSNTEKTWRFLYYRTAVRGSAATWPTYLFDPEIIVVGGEAVEFGDALLAPIRRTVEEFAFFTKPELVPDWVPSSWARGAAALATQNIFEFERSPSR